MRKILLTMLIAVLTFSCKHKYEKRLKGIEPPLVLIANSEMGNTVIAGSNNTYLILTKYSSLSQALHDSYQPGDTIKPKELSNK